MPSVIQKRDYPCDDDEYYRDGRCYYYRSHWEVYGRWIVVAAVIAAGILIFFIFACITARRRRAAGFAPYRGTGWAAGRPPPGHAPAQYTSNQQYYGGGQYNNQQQPQAPPYGNPSNQEYYGGNGGNPGYFGGQQNGVELQQPQSAHQRGGADNTMYSPPAGPPPGKGGDGIIR